MSKYTPSMVEKMRALAPLDLSKARKLASDFGNVSYRSIISKAKSEGIEYAAAARAAKMVVDSSPVKADILKGIRKSLALPPRTGDLTKLELETIFEHIS